MAVTIQTIETPKKARGLDTSAGEQIVGNQLLGDPSFDTDVSAGSVNIGTWKCEDSHLEITGGKAVWTAYTGSEDRRLVDNISGPFDDVTARYRATITVSDYTDGALRLVTGSYNSGFVINSTGTFTFDFSPETGAGNYHLVASKASDSEGDAVLSVSEVSLYKLESFPNNNHAQIYSGRGLEFDGVTDYLKVDIESNDKPFDFLMVTKTYTVSCWIKVSNFTNSVIWMQHSGSTANSRVGLILGSDGMLSNTVWNGSAYVSVRTTNALQLNTWYRIVCTNSGTTAVNNDSETLKMYVNGVKQLENDAEAYTSPFSGSNTDFTIGAKSDTPIQGYFEGCLSDFQGWNKVWTVDDAEYDYLNPEQLALNKSGTSLTNSNLKLWYPMNEGHRGEQSYVLDASNTGIGDDILDWSSTFNASGTSTDDFGNWTTNANDSTTFCTFDHDNKTIRLRTTDTTHLQAFYVPEILKYGTTYKFEFTVSEITSGSVRIRPQNTTEYLSVSETGTYSYIVSPESSITDLDFRIERDTTAAADFTISDVKIFPINDKNSATTVFFGDDLFDSGVGDYGDSTGAWTAEGNNTIANDTSALKITYVDNDDGAKLFLKDAADLTSDLTVGRNYRLTFTYKINQVSGANVSLQINQGDATFKTTGTLNQTSFTTITKDFTAMHATNANVRFNNLSSGDILHVKDFILKEIGLASGWTDADQQLDMSQTALQSYNQLGYSLGSEDTSGGTINCGSITSGAWTTLDIWFFPQESGYNQGLLDQVAWNGDDANPSTGGYGFRVTISATNKIVLTRRVSGTSDSNSMTSTNKINIGEWNHVAVVIPKITGTSMRMMVNGHYEQATSSGDHGNTSKNFKLGYGGSIHYDSMPGCIAQASYFKAHMSESEMLELYNEGTPIDSRNHSIGTANLAGYWRNNGINGNTWINLANPGTNDGSPATLIKETMLITAGVDSSRDSQGFFMNRQKTTNTLNLPLINIAGNTYTIGSSEIEIPNPSLIYSDTGFSVECWFKAAMLGEPMFFICHQEAGNSAEGFHLRWAGGNVVYAAISDGTNEASTAIGGTLNADQWYHIVASWDHSNKKKYVYIDGILRQVETESSMGTIAPNADIHIGTRRGETDQDFIGQIDDVKLYNRILTDGGVTTGQSDGNSLSTAAGGEVLRNYNAGKRSHK